MTSSAPDLSSSRTRRVTAKPRGGRSTSLLWLARTGVAVVSCGAVAISGLVWAETHHLVDGFTMSNALGADAPHSSGGGENILLMGLDTRKDLNGQDLPDGILKQLHAGDSSNGGYNTNTMILVHIPADRKNIVAFSIPRDDLVRMDDVDVPEAKIKEAYGRKKAITEDELQKEGVTDPQELETRGREAGRAETIKTVRNLTGVPIDRFAEVSLFGFYDVAKALGGVKVCLNHAVSDSYSGAKFKAGEQTLDGKQSLAFVRQRHGLDNGDLDRTHRQQAFMLSVLNQLRDAGTFTSIDKVNALVDVAQRNVVLSDGWNLVDWIQQMGSVSDQRITFTTLPVVRYDTFDGQDVNIVDPAVIRSRVQKAFGVKPTPAPITSSVEPSSTDQSSPDQSSPDRSETGASTDPATATVSDAPPPDSGTSLSSSSGVPCVN
ncbi:transcriptional regulator [Gordonia sihwensis]|uniref:Putative LytR family regulatory protein n=1 Tax=Gordonia sihwensis NBRC 108236 TaxID=1223544 RepID=L7LLV1_9ACTN|nr:LytR family transcriptional regulator [Gordonia sp. YC-JH1]KJR09195.1 LytR family regulatory protein [Gordonia sihwensis]MBY4569314.1 transcriptional regulator [Gordonia sihwensis]GAC61864.1 putative LytR family regulatory protein [Gordonia sihwensis NBRC 108236]